MLHSCSSLPRNRFLRRASVIIRQDGKFFRPVRHPFLPTSLTHFPTDSTTATSQRFGPLFLEICQVRPPLQVQCMPDGHATFVTSARSDAVGRHPTAPPASGKCHSQIEYERWILNHIISHQRVCSYRNHSRDGPERGVISPSTAIDESSLLQQSQQDRSGVASRFLDYEIFQRGEANLPPTLRVPSLIPSYVRPFVGGNAGFKEVATRYYQLVHPWLPVISKRKIYDHLLNPLLPLRVDAVFLCLCMKLFIQPPENENPWTPEYCAATRFFSEIQVAGVLSMETLQGCVLLAVYEIGHAMYPAAQVSLGTSLKCAFALGIGWTASTKETFAAASWMEAEERRRTWWAIFMLERFVNSNHSSVCHWLLHSPSHG